MSAQLDGDRDLDATSERSAARLPESNGSSDAALAAPGRQSNLPDGKEEEAHGRHVEIQGGNPWLASHSRQDFHAHRVHRAPIRRAGVVSAVACGIAIAQEEEGPSSLESVYAEIIVNAKKLEPLKSKENPKVSASNCVHPKSSLKGGGHRSVSYITRKDCHSRWEKEIKSFPSRRTARW